LKLKELALVDTDWLNAIPRVPERVDDDASQDEPTGKVRRGCQPRRLPQDRLAEVIKRYQAGETLKTLAADCGFSRDFLVSQFHRAGVAIRLHLMTEDDIRDAMYRYGTSESLAVIDKQLGFDAGTVCRAFVHVGVALRDTHDRLPSPNEA